MVVADTGAVLALLDRSDRHHAELRRLYERDRDAWIVPWAVLPEADYLIASELGDRAAQIWFEDLVNGSFAVQWSTDANLRAAHTLARRYASLQLGLVDAVVMAIAERLTADIATLDLRDFGAVRLKHSPRLLPRDLGEVPRRRR
jgi:predicted nucleic acid-binding protein